MSWEGNTFNVGEKVHVEFDGTVYQYPGEYMQNTVSPNHFAVTDGTYIHHVHRGSTNNGSVTKDPRPAVEVGQVWRADGRNFLAYHHGEGEFVGPWFAGSDRPGISSVEILTTPDDFFKRYPDATLELNPDGSSLL